MPTMTNAQADEAARQPSRKPLTNAVHCVLRSLEPLDAISRARGEAALNLARRLDATVDARAGTQSQAAPGMTKELDRLLSSLVDPQKDAAALQLIADIFGRKDN